MKDLPPPGPNDLSTYTPADPGMVPQEVRALVDKLPPPRNHHYIFVHRLLPAMAFRDLPRLLSLLDPERGTSILREMWEQLGQAQADQGMGEALPSDGLDLSFREVEGFPTLLIRLPPAERPPEAHFVALVVAPARRVFVFFRSKPKVRLFTLESGIGHTGDARTVLCEWSPGPTHHNYGEGPVVEETAFLRVIGFILRGVKPEVVTRIK